MKKFKFGYESKGLFSFLLVSLVIVGLVGCGSPRPENMTPEEEAEYQRAESQRAREMLSDTSPRNMNNLPKAIPEFRTRFTGWKSRPVPETQPQPSVEIEPEG